MASEDCKQIEKCIKDLIFKSCSDTPSTYVPAPKPVLSFPATSRDDPCLVSNIEKLAHQPKTSSLVADTANDQSCSSTLIDLQVLKNFAAQHISESELTPKVVKVPHPDDFNSPPKNGEIDIQKGLTILLQNMTKGMKNSDRNNDGLPQKPHDDLNERPAVNNVNEEKTSTRKPGKKKKRTRSATRKKMKEKLDSLYVPKDNQKYLNEDKSEEVNVSKTEGVKILAKRSPEEDTYPGIKMKNSALSMASKQYTMYLDEGHFMLKCHLCNYNHGLKDSVIQHLGSKNHTTKQKQYERDLMLPFLPGPLPEQLEAIDLLLKEIVLLHGLQSKDLECRQSLQSRLHVLGKTILPSCDIDLIGSAATGCGLKNSEVDFILRVPSDEDIPDSLEKLYNFMKSDSSFLCVENEFKKVRPSINFTDKETGLSCSIQVDNASSLKLAQLIKTYLSLDDRVLPFGIALRYWARLCEIDCQDSGTLPVTCFSLMLIHFLQQVQPPVLPVLHEAADYEGTEAFLAKYLKEKRWKSENTDSLSALWLKFFKFYSFDYVLGEHVVCIRTLKRMTCKERSWSTKFYAIEDPFVRRNLSYVIPTFQVCTYIYQCFLRTYKFFAYPRLKDGEVNVVKNESFDLLSCFQIVPTKPPSREESEKSLDSDDDSDILNAVEESLEDHDSAISMNDFVSTMNKMSLDDPNSNSTANGKMSDASSSDSTTSSDKCPDKTAVDRVASKTNTQPMCYWAIAGKLIRKDLFQYKFKPVLFRGEKSVPVTCKLCKGSGHRKKDCPTEELPKARPLPEMTQEYLDCIIKALNHVKNKHAVSQAELDKVIADMRDIEKHLKEVFPDATLTLFGSFCNGFGFKNKSDMDFCLTFGDQDSRHDLDCTKVIEIVARELSHHPALINIVPITSAKVPIVKFAWRKNDIEGDISLYNTLALENTEMLDAYSKIDSRVQVLGYALKHFAKVLGICDASRGSLSSYAYILMVIFFLQQRNPPVIPVLQELHGEKKPTKLIDGWNVWYFKEIDKLKEAWSDYGKNTENVGQLWLGLLIFYTCEFKWKEYVISIRQRAPLTRFKKLWNTSQLAIEDPFDLNHNLGAGLSRKMNNYILTTFFRARERFGIPVSIERIRAGHEMDFLFDRNYLNSGLEPPHDRGCGNCGKIGHIARNCPQEKTCSWCRKTGHLIKDCPRKAGKGKKSQEPKQNLKHDERKEANERPNQQRHMSRIINQNMSDYLNRTYPDMKPVHGETYETQKLLHMGIPTHRMPPPPGFPSQGPPPGFGPAYPPPFGNRPSHVSPFPRGGNNNMPPHQPSPPKQLAGSPPKHFQQSRAGYQDGTPPKHFQQSRAGYQDGTPSKHFQQSRAGYQDGNWPHQGRQFPGDRGHNMPPRGMNFDRGAVLAQHGNAPLPVIQGASRTLQGAPQPWSNRSQRNQIIPQRGAHLQSNQMHNYDHRQHRTHSDSSIHQARWQHH